MILAWASPFNTVSSRGYAEQPLIPPCKSGDMVVTRHWSEAKYTYAGEFW